MDDPTGGTPHPSVPEMEQIDFKGSRVIARVDINAPVEQGRVAGTARLDAAARSIQELLDVGAGVVVLGHQGRPGREDFTSLEQHAELIAEKIGREVPFTPHVADREALAAVEDTDPGDVLLLGNVRSAEGEIEEVEAEEHAERPWVQKLAGTADAFVLDGFSVAHRSHASIVGFPLLLPSCAGPVMQRELDALRHVEEPTSYEERVLVLGGVKVDDAVRVIEHHFRAGLVDRVLTGGIVAEAFLVARGHELGEPTDEVLRRHDARDSMARVRRLLERFGDAIETPVDLACEHGGRRELSVAELPVTDGPILDVGAQTVARYGEAIHAADTVLLNGPLGAYEREGFAAGTEGVLEACARTDAYTLLGGGHTVTALERAGWHRSDFDHVSLAGGALVHYLCGERLPGLCSLAESARRFALDPPTA